MRELFFIFLMLPLFFAHCYAEDIPDMLADLSGARQAQEALSEEEKEIAGELRLDGSYDTKGAIQRLWEALCVKGKEQLILSLRSVSEMILLALLCAVAETSRTGRITGNNCHDSEKISRFLRDYPNGSVDVFYSDSLSDSPMAWFASKAFLVKEGRELVPWPNK